MTKKKSFDLLLPLNHHSDIVNGDHHVSIYSTNWPSQAILHKQFYKKKEGCNWPQSRTGTIQAAEVMWSLFLRLWIKYLLIFTKIEGYSVRAFFFHVGQTCIFCVKAIRGLWGWRSFVRGMNQFSKSFLLVYV